MSEVGGSHQTGRCGRNPSLGAGRVRLLNRNLSPSGMLKRGRVSERVFRWGGVDGEKESGSRVDERQ